MKKLLLLAAMALCGTTLASAQSPVPPPNTPMQFSLAHTDMGASGHCCAWIAAEGEITKQTPDEFKAFLKKNSIATASIRLNSPGGSLIAGIKLGEMFREGKFSTEVGSTHTTAGVGWDSKRKLWTGPPPVKTKNRASARPPAPTPSSAGSTARPREAN
jgi:hypothetical protein